MHHAGAGVDGHEVRRHDPPCHVLPGAGTQAPLFLALVLPIAVERRPVAPADQLVAADCRFHRELLAAFSGHGFDEGGGQNQLAALPFDGDHGVIQIGLDGRELVAGQRPGRGRPDQQIHVRLPEHREADIDARVGHLAIALADFARREGRATLGPPPDDLVALVQQPAVEQVLQRPPDAFHVALVVGHVGLVELDPEA